MSALKKFVVQGRPLRAQCEADGLTFRRSCQDLFALLCNALYMLEEQGHAETVPGFSAQQCVEEYNAPRPVALHFETPALIHRQIPGVTAKAWWPDEAIPYGAVERIKLQIPTIQEEVLRVASESGFQGWDPLSNDPSLTTNANWDPRASWDAIPLFFQNTWVEKGCGLFPITCGVLKKERDELEGLCNTSRYAELVPESVRVKQDYDEVPTLGVKLYRIWPGAGLKSHTGSPGRLVNSVALQAPVNCTITVGGETRPWVTGVMQHFDDAFYHSVDNPHSSEFRIVMAIMTWHPDLNPDPLGNPVRESVDEL